MKEQLVFGLHAVTAILVHKPERVRRLQLQENLREKAMISLIDQAKTQHLSIEFVKKATLDKLTQDALHQGVVAFCVPIETWSEVDLFSYLDHLNRPAFLLCLDGVQDPHNLGACMRTALAAGVDALIVPKDKSCGLTSVVYKVAVGAADILPFVQVTNLTRCMETLKEKGIWFIGAQMQGGQPIYDMDLTGSIAWVLGAEGQGLRDNTQKHCDYLAYIPMSDLVESLNVSVAAGICLFETLRQRAIITCTVSI